MSGALVPLTMPPKADLAEFGKSLVALSAVYPPDAMVVLTVPVAQLRGMGRRLEVVPDPVGAQALEASRAHAAQLARMLAQEKARLSDMAKALQKMRRAVPFAFGVTLIGHGLIAWLAVWS